MIQKGRKIKLLSSLRRPFERRKMNLELGSGEGRGRCNALICSVCRLPRVPGSHHGQAQAANVQVAERTLREMLTVLPPAGLTSHRGLVSVTALTLTRQVPLGPGFLIYKMGCPHFIFPGLFGIQEYKSLKRAWDYHQF